MDEYTCISYKRKSTKVKENEQTESVEYQDKKIKEYASRHHMKLLKEFTDVGFSGASSSRPGLQDMLRFIKSQTVKINSLLIYTVDRLGRNLKGNVDVIKEIFKYIDEVIFTEQGLKVESKDPKYLLYILSGQAEEMRDLLLQNVINGKRSKILNQKKFVGTIVPIGYTRRFNKNELVAATERNTENHGEIQGLKILKHIFYLYLMGETLEGIARILNAIYGLTNRGNKWAYSSVRHILTNPIYVGVLRGQITSGENYYVTDAKVEKLVDPLAFELVQQRIKVHERGRPLKKTLHKHSHFVLCKRCAEPLKQTRDKLICENCKKEVDVFEVESILLEESLKLVKENFKFNTSSNDIRDILRIKQKRLGIKIAGLNTELSYMDVDTMNSPEDKSQISQCFRKELEPLLRQKQVDNELQGWFEQHRLESFYAMNTDYVFKLPYLIIADLESKKIIVLFHREVFRDEQPICQE